MCERALEASKAKFEDPYSGHTTPAGIWVEPIQGEGGVVVPPEDFLPGLLDIADDNDALLVGVPFAAVFTQYVMGELADPWAGPLVCFGLAWVVFGRYLRGRRPATPTTEATPE